MLLNLGVFGFLGMELHGSPWVDNIQILTGIPTEAPAAAIVSTPLWAIIQGSIIAVSKGILGVKTMARIINIHQMAVSILFP